ADVRDQLSSLQETFRAAVNAAETTDQKLSAAYGFMGQVYHAYALTNAAEECYINARRLAPDDYRWAHLLGNLYEAMSRPADAIENYKAVRRSNPDYLPATVRLGDLLLQQNLLDAARSSFAAALALDPKCSAARYGLGQVALSSRQYADAVKLLEQAAAEVPGANRIHYALAMAYRGLGEIDKARSHLERQGPVGIRVSDPLVDGLQELIRGERLHLVRGRMAFDAKRFQEAAEQYRKALAANPKNVAARLNLGSSLGQLGDDKAAAEQFEQVLRLEPGHAGAHYNLAVLLARQNQPEPAIVHLRSVLEADAADNQARFVLAQQLARVGRLEDALTEFARVTDAEPGNEDALLERVSLLLKTKQDREALKALERGHSASPQNGRTMIMLAYLLATNPNYELRDGKRSLELAEKVYRSTGVINHGAVVAMALAESGRCGEAAELQRNLISAAERDNLVELAGKLKGELRRYELGQPCRPGALTIAPDQPTPKRDPQRE
ncbi:MAG TPA: tetratricopeptide repeat protein, partial [Blastocatellia bacterium]|nr:tetratricopeptide repeat protein [Blastocatellia bacterium]